MSVYTWLDRKLAYYKSSLRNNSYEVIRTIDSDIRRSENLYPKSLQGLELKYIRALSQLNCGSLADAMKSFDQVLSEGISVKNSELILGLSEFLLGEMSYLNFRDYIKAKIRYKNAIIHFEENAIIEYSALSKLRICEINLETGRTNDCIRPLEEISELLGNYSLNSKPMDHIEDSEFLKVSGVSFDTEKFQELPSKYLGIQAKVDYSLGKTKNAVKNVENALRLDELNDLKYSKISNLIIKAEILLEEGEYIKSQEVYQECIDMIAGNVRVYFKSLCTIYRAMAEIYLSESLSDEKRAFKYLMLSLNLAKQYQLIPEACKVLGIYSTLNSRESVDKLSLSVNAENLIHWLELSSAASSKAIKVQVFRSIGTYFYTCSDYEEAISYLDKANSINTSLNSESMDLAESKIDFIKEVGGFALKLKQLELDKANVKIESQSSLAIDNDILKRELNSKESDLKEVSDELKDYLKIATHDFKEPIRNIVNMTQLLKDKIGDSLSKDHDELMNYVISCSLQLNGLSNDLIEYVNISHNNPRRQRIDLRAMIDRINASDINENGAKHLTIHLDLEVEKIIADYNSTYNLFKNLLKNAVHFNKEGLTPKVRIISRELDDHWKFAVMDNGIGIEDKNFDEIFKPFTKLRKTSGPENNGIGLSICKKAVELHGGRIWLNSIPGKGTTFHFTLYKEAKLKENQQVKG